ncbi:hypothetical protein BGX29_003676 [Mortierella sp. GBA35]|nr:hypothetical protein BGX29_003676 [Mortierella sp. GBA35]
MSTFLTRCASPPFLISTARLDALVSQSKQDRPEVRAKSSIGLVALVSENGAAEREMDSDRAEEDVKSDDLVQVDAWIAIARGLGDEWPLVREAFQEQLVAGFGHPGTTVQTQIGQDALLDRMIARAQETVKAASERLAFVTGILALVNIKQEDDGVSCKSWDDGRVDTLLAMAIEGWAPNQGTSQATRSLGSMTTTSSAQSTQTIMFVEFATTALRSLTVDTDTSADSASTAVAVPQVRDWALAIWLCDKLWIPRVFSSRTHLEESPGNRKVAKSFAESAHMLLECLGQILRIQTVDNTYTLHRVIMACAAFTNVKDLWNQRYYPSISKATMDQADQNLKTIIQQTHWSVNSSSNNSPSSSSSSSRDDDHHGQQNRNTIMIPGSFSDHVIQILEKEIRPSFAHVQAHKVAQRAQATIEMHQDKLKQQYQQKPIAIVEGRKGDDDDGSTTITITGTAAAGKDLVRQQQQQQQRQDRRFKIAPVWDTPNDEDEFSSMMDNRLSFEDDPALPRRWDVDFLEAVPIAEWCSQQPIQDSSRILEVFMLLVGPILAMTDSAKTLYRTRGLNLLSRFLIRYHDDNSKAGSTIDQHGPPRSNGAAAESRRIWIKIFERTGLDQVLERTLTPLLAPIQAMFTPAPEAEQDQDPDESEHSMELWNATFRAYLTLILVNTEPDNKPTSPTDDSNRISLSQQSAVGSAVTTTLTVENLFIHGVLGSFKRANPSREYRSVVLEWLARLVRPVVSLDFIIQDSYPLPPTPDSNTGFQGIFGMGSLTIKYLPTLIPYLCGILEFPLPSSPPFVRLESLTLAWRASEALCQVMDVSRPRIPRHRGQLLATICKCWANSRILSSDTTTTPTASASSSEAGSIKKNLEQEQTRLDNSLVRSMRLCIEICQPKIADDTPSGLEMDLKILRELDPSVFSPLFAS